MFVYIFIKLEGFGKHVFYILRCCVLVVNVEEYDLLIKNADVLTMCERSPRAVGFVVKDGRIVTVFRSNEEVEKLAGEVLEVLDIGGKSIIPGFFDGHTHLASLGVGFSHLNLGDTKSLVEALYRIKDKVEEVGEGEDKWIIGFGWDEAVWEEKRYITGNDINRVAFNNPVFLRRICCHLITVNSLAFNKLKIDPYAPGVEKDSKGEVTGVLADVKLDLSSIRPSKEEVKEAIRKACNYANSLGITSVNDFASDYQFEHYLEMDMEDEGKREERRLTVRVNLCPNIDFLEELKVRGLKTGDGSDFLKIGALKIFFDGSIGAYTAKLSEPYSDRKETRGKFMRTRKEFKELIERAVSLGFQTASHAIGDEAIKLVLDVFEELEEKYSEIRGQRHRIEHAELLMEEGIERVKRLGLFLSMQPNFLQWQGEKGFYWLRLGEERCGKLNEFRKIIDAEIELSFGSDGMPLGPFFGIKQVVINPRSNVKVSLEEALYCYTLGPAKASFIEHERGSIEEGKLADFIVLSEDPFKISPQMLDKIRIEKTFVGGFLVYDRERDQTT